MKEHQTMTEVPAEKSLERTYELIQEMSESGFDFDFFQAIRRIDSCHPSLPRLGSSVRASQEAIRIAQTPALDFAPATIDQVTSDDDGRATVKQRFFGLLGPSGPLPTHMTEQVQDQIRNHESPTLEGFLNLFHHRMASLFYRAWCSSRGAIQRDRPAEDGFAKKLGAIAGGAVMTHRETALYFAGHFASSHRNAEGLASIVSRVVGIEARVQSFVLRSLSIQPEDHTRLTRSETSAGRGGTLGGSVVLGRRIADRRSMIGLELGPMPLDSFESLIPDGSMHDRLRDVIRSYIDPGLDCRVNLILDRRGLPAMSLGQTGRLGRVAWLFSGTADRDLSDYQFQV